MKKLVNRKGFTLIELMIVITVIAILSAIAMFAFTRVQSGARDSRKKAEMKSLQTAVLAYFADNGDYPPTGAAGFTCLAGGGGTGCTGTVKYISAVFKAPNAPTGLAKDYVYVHPANTQQYCLTVSLENNDPTIGAATAWYIGATSSSGKPVADAATCTAD